MPTESANPRIYTAWNGQGGVQVTNITTNIQLKVTKIGVQIQN